MRTRNLFALTLGCLSLVPVIFLAACGSSGSAKTQSTPVFTSTPVAVATQDVAYTYQLTAIDPAGGTVTFSLATAPAGTSFSGGDINTITWVPTAAQSRVSNSFAVKATTTSGGTAQQQWTVTPGGTITVNWINDYWGPNGQVPVPQQASLAANLSAMWTNPDGSYTVHKGSATATPGVFSIPNVPGGNYWLQNGVEAFWTSSGTFDLGANYAGPPTPTTGSSTPSTQFTFTLSGLESVPEFTPVSFLPAAYGIGPLQLFDSTNSTTLTQQQSGYIGSYVDWSQINTAFLMQWAPQSLTSSGNVVINNLVLGPSLTATGLSLTSGGTNPITETLQTSPQASITLSVPGASLWAPAFTSVAPAAPTPLASALGVSAQMYVTQGLATGTTIFSSSGGLGVGVEGEVALPSQMILASTESVDQINFTGCNLPGFILATPTVVQPAITTDQNFGALQYGDPYPSGWTRVLSLCQEATASIPIPGSTATATFLMVDNAAVAPSSTPLGPVVLPVQNPTMNGASFFGSSATTTNTITLGWNAPTGTAPIGYTVRVYILTTVEGLQTYTPTGGTLSTAGTSITLPPLAGGNTYVFTIAADADGSANIQTSPFRSSLPTGTAMVVSGPVAINPAAQMPAIHGDRRVIMKFSQPQTQVAPH